MTHISNHRVSKWSLQHCFLLKRKGKGFLDLEAESMKLCPKRPSFLIISLNLCFLANAKCSNASHCHWWREQNASDYVQTEALPGGWPLCYLVPAGTIEPWNGFTLEFRDFHLARMMIRVFHSFKIPNCDFFLIYFICIWQKNRWPRFKAGKNTYETATNSNICFKSWFA